LHLIHMADYKKHHKPTKRNHVQGPRDWTYRKRKRPSLRRFKVDLIEGNNSTLTISQKTTRKVIPRNPPSAPPPRTGCSINIAQSSAKGSQARSSQEETFACNTSPDHGPNTLPCPLESTASAAEEKPRAENLLQNSTGL
jgi:hypothetical protein